MTEGTIYTIASGKGGVGKTTLSANLAAGIASAGKRTIVIDADLGMANLANHLGITGDVPTLHDVLAGRVDVDVVTHDVGEYLLAIPGAIDLDAYAAIDPDRLEMVVDTVRRRYDYVILDAGAGLNYDSALPLRMADAVVIVTDVTPTAIEDARKTVDLTDRVGGTVEGVIVNRTTPDMSPAPSDIAVRLGIRHLGSIPDSSAVPASLRASTPIVWHTPFDDASVAMRSVAGSLTGLEIPRPAPPTPGEAVTDGHADPEPDPSPGLLRRLLGR